MSVPSKSIDKNKRYAGVKANDFVNKTRTNETSRAATRTQGWANLGKINSRRIPPPANLPSIKSETGTIPPAYDPTISTGTSHGWTASGNQTPTAQTRPLTPSKQPTQQQLDSLPAHSSTPPPLQTSSTLSSDNDKPRLPTTWSTVTSGSTGNSTDQPPNLLGLNDFPRLVTQDNNKNLKSSPDSLLNSISNNTTQGPSFRPANLASWKEGGGRAQPSSNDLIKDSNDNNLPMQSQILPTNSLQSQIQNPNNSSYMRMYQPPQSQQQQQQQQMWNYNMNNSYGSYGPNQPSTSMPMHQLNQQRVSSFGSNNNNNNNQSQNSQRLTTSHDYKTPTILRNKDIDDLSKLTNNDTWANASQEVNYEEKIRFSDDEDNDIPDNNNKSRRYNNNNNNNSQQSRQTYPQVLQNTNRSLQTTRSRLLQDDEHVKQMQDDKNSELINTLTVAKQRRDEQERHLRDQKQIPGYQTRPLITSTGQESSSQIDSSSSSWGQTAQPSSTTTTTTTAPPPPPPTSRTRHDTSDSQTFALKSWSDQMDSFNYASLHEKSSGQANVDDHNDETNLTSTTRTHKYSRSASESSSQSQPDNITNKIRSKHFPLTNRKPQRTTNYRNTKSRTTDVSDYFDNNNTNNNDQWGDWDDSNYQTNTTTNNNNRYQQNYSHDRRRQQQTSDDLSQKSNRYHDQTNDYNRTKQSTKTRTNTSRSSDVQTSLKSENKPISTKTQPAWRPLSPTRTLETADPTPQEAITYKSQLKSNDIPDRRQSAPTERKSRYTTSTTTPINTSSIPPLMSVRSDVPPPSVSTTTTSKHLKTSKDYNTSSHYSQRNDFYNDTNDAAWGNDDEYYDDETGYYDPNMQTHQRHHQSMGYHSHGHHRGYTTLGSYGRYRRGGSLRHQQYNTYNVNNTSSPTSSSQLNTSTGSKTKKTVTSRTTVPNKKSDELLSEPVKPVEETPKVLPEEQQQPVKKPSAWATIEQKPTTIEEIPIIKSIETPPVIEKPSENDTNNFETDSTNKQKTTPTTTTSQKRTNYQQDQRYQNQQAPRYRNSYGRSMQDYESMQISSQNYFQTNRRTARGGRSTRMHDLSNNYYYEHPQQRYNNRYSYSTDHYSQSHQTRTNNKTSKRGQSTTAIITDRQQSNKDTNLPQQSISDNEQKEGEEWETASESSTNMRTNPQQTNKTTIEDTKTTTRDRTPPKKSFSNQRPTNSRHNETNPHRRTHNIYDRGTKSTRGIRTNRLTPNSKQTSSQKPDEESFNNKQPKKDQHRHSLDGYDLNNVAGVVKIETLPAGALEEESTAYDDEDFCVVLSKRDRKEQKAAQLSKQNAVETTAATTTIEQPVKSVSIDNDEQQTNEKSSNENNSTRTRTGKSLPPRFNSKSTNSSTRQNKTDHQNYYDQNYYYYYGQNQYYDDDSYYNYNTYNQSHRQTSTRRKQQQQQQTRNQTQQQQQQQQQQQEPNSSIDEKKHDNEKPSANVMSNIQMWNPHTDNTISNTSKLIEKPIHERKYPNDIVPSSSNDTTLPLHQRSTNDLSTHSPVSKTNETIARTIKPPIIDNKSDHREPKTKSSNYEKNDTISSLGSNQLFEKSTFLDYDDKQSIGTVGDDYNQKINSLKTIWDISDHPSGQLEQTINTMVAMQQQQENNVQSNNSNKSDNYVQESIPTSSTNTNISSTNNDDTNNKNSSTNTSLQTNNSSSTINQSTTYSTNTNTNKNEQKNICTVKPTQQVPPNIQDQVDVNTYQTFPPPPLPPPLQQQQQQHILPQSQVNSLHQQQHSYPFYEPLLPQPPQQQPPPPPQQQQQFNRIYSSTTNTTSTDPLNSDFSSVQSSQIYPPQNFPYRNTNVFMPPPNVPNTNSMYHHTSQGSISAPPQNNAMPPPPPMPNYPSPFLVDHGGHMIGQPQPPPPPPQAYMNNQMMPGRPQGGQYYRTPPQQQLQTPPGPPYGTQDPLAHGGYYPPFFQPPNSNAPPVGHPSPHNLYGQNDGFHPPHPQMFARGGSIDRGDHPLMSQPPSRPTSYPSTSSNPQQQPPPPPQQQQGPPPSLLSQNLKSFHTNQQQTSSSNQGSFYPPPNQYNRPPMPIGALNNTNNRQQPQQVPSLMSGLNKNFSNNGNNFNNTPSLLQHRQPLIPPQTNNNRPLYQHHPQYPTYSKSTGSNDDNVKPKHI